jgi:hypothetical protein
MFDGLKRDQVVSDIALRKQPFMGPTQALRSGNLEAWVRSKGGRRFKGLGGFVPGFVPKRPSNLKDLAASFLGLFGFVFLVSR